MGNKTFGRTLFILSLALLPACTAHVEEAGEWLTIAVKASGPATKTTMTDDGSDTKFRFSAGDKMGFFADGVLNNKPLTCTDAASGSFSGSINLTESQTIARPSIDYYAYYPYDKIAGTDPSALTATLPSTQRAPFDGQADYLVAVPVTDKYDVDDFPDLNFVFSTHLFAVVKLSVINTDDAFAGEQLLSIGLKSTDPGTPLAGQFTFSVVDGNVDFTDESYQVLVEYATPPTLGKGITHNVYAVVNAASYASGKLSLVVNTTNNTFTVPSQIALSLNTNQMTALNTVDIASASRRNRVRTIVLWGDSITGHSLLLAVQEQLGANWNVIRGGVAGDSAQQVASRQGGLPMYTGSSSFKIPASSEQYVYIDGIYYRDGETYGQATHEWTFKAGYTPQLNPLIIQGVECEISYDTEQEKRRIRRLADGENDVDVPARSEVSTYGSRAYKNVDVIVVEMGGNSRTTDERLIGFHNAMFDHLTNPNAKIIVNGFCMSSTDWPTHWTSSYVTKFTNEYGNYFIDQRTLSGGANAIRMMKELGQITDESQIGDSDWVYINRGDWPISWFRSPTDIHPNDQYGAKVLAINLRRRMDKLGLL